ncbi:Acyltransferase ChoActase/COT/CPT [Macrophomina phaseolina MS6]|uniref:Acyltransferase ChoActase/COT/CPT n=2 Tax=Macrophomina phaseolina TaxID=35725 RepID=K2SBD5_MACPH|nr:Acyltransferase ChoActase/COT/CPT [Macrophomina phaseolina MS6]KAH7025442.1 carnitine acetyl transferas-like protein [Macrophomina phaseolina]
MPVRTFQAPTSLNGTLAKEVNGANASTMSDTSADHQRSAQAAKEATNDFSKADQNPLGAARNPNSKPGITFAAQDKLPTLPIPDLEASCSKYLAALAPLQSPKERQETRAAVRDFLKNDGPELQEKLKKYAAGKANYIEQFWYDSYLNFDNPVVLNLNPFFLLEDDPTPARNNQVTRAASLVVSALSFVRAVRKEELPPDTVRGQPLCMYQYSRLFGTARIPTENGCQIGQDPNAKHIVVLCHGQFYWFDVLDDNSDLIMTEKDISLNLEAIIDDAAQIPIQEAAKGALGVLSTENRKVWSGLRDVLHRDEGSNNSDCLNIVDSALFILCLDYTEPTTGADLCMNMLCGTSKIERGVQVGTCTNRWYDKLQIIVCKNGSAGINFEHTGVDGHTVLRFASDVYTDTILRFARTINGQAPSLWASSSPDPSKRDPASFGDVSTTPHKLEWDMVPELSTALRFAETRLADLIQQNEFQTLEFGHYGKHFMTSMGFSPDAFVQMAFQAAYYGLYGRMECVYEPAMTKMFYHGRTEAIRPVTEESVEFVQTFWNDNPAADKVEALRKACEKHVAITKECAKAQGQDRHLYALYCIWQRQLDEEGSYTDGASYTDSLRDSSGSPIGSEQIVGSPGRNSILSEEGSISTGPAVHHVEHRMPSLFADAGWDRLNTTILSTSNCGNPSLRQFGFGPTSGDGFGIGYIIKDGSISICASSKHRQTSRFIDAIEAYFLEIRKLLRQTRRRGASATKGASRAREAEEQQEQMSASRIKSRGRKILGEPGSKAGAQTPAADSIVESDDEGLGGYGFFDSGMLQAALKAKHEQQDALLQNDNKEVVRRNIGRRLKLADY